MSISAGQKYGAESMRVLLREHNSGVDASDAEVRNATLLLARALTTLNPMLSTDENEFLCSLANTLYWISDGMEVQS